MIFWICQSIFFPTIPTIRNYSIEISSHTTRVISWMGGKLIVHMAINGNKLKVRSWSTSSRENRHESLIPTRLCIGHTWLTQGHLIVGEEAPFYHSDSDWMSWVLQATQTVPTLVVLVLLIPLTCLTYYLSDDDLLWNTYSLQVYMMLYRLSLRRKLLLPNPTICLP